MSNCKYSLSSLIAVLSLLLYFPRAYAEPPISGDTWHRDDLSGLAVFNDALFDTDKIDFSHDGNFPSHQQLHPVDGRADLAFYYLTQGGARVDNGIVKPSVLFAPVASTKQAIHFPPKGADKSIEYLLAPDLRRVVVLKNGDLYRGIYDWSVGRVVEEKQMTQVGVLRSRPFLWHDNIVLMYGGFDEKKPLVRVDMVTGELGEYPTFDVLTPSPRAWNNAIVTPSGSHILKQDNEILRVLDVRTMEMTRVSALSEYEFRGRMTEMPISFLRNETHRWLDDRRLLASDKTFGTIGLLDLSSQSVRRLSPQDQMLEFVELLPGNQFVDAILKAKSPASRRDTSGDKRILLEINNGNIREIDVPTDVDIAWISERYGLFIRNDGGLSAVGTWLFDVSTNSLKRLTAKKASLRMARLMPQRERVYFYVFQDGTYSYDLKSQRFEKFSDESKKVLPFGEPVDLGFSDSVGSLWVVRDYDALVAAEKVRSANVVATAVVDTKSKPETLVDVLRELEGEPEAIRDEAEEIYNIYSRKSSFDNFYSPALATMEFVKLRKLDPGASISSLRGKIDFSKTYCPDRTYETVRESTYSTSGSIKDEALRNQRADWVAQAVVNKVDEDIARDDFQVSRIQSYIIRARVDYARQMNDDGKVEPHAEAEVEAASTNIAEENPTEETAEAPPQPISIENEARRVGDEVIDDISNKAKNKFRGLFGK